jgi:dTDP-L-rhamnose 4-epimerase
MICGQSVNVIRIDTELIMSVHALITGGAGFIGSHVADELLQAGHKVRILDNLSEQVHGPDRKPPKYLADDAELIIGDVRDSSLLEKTLSGIDVVYHFASLVGVGQSMYEIQEYVNVNDYGTACLLQAIIKSPIEKLVIASSMSIYGEGQYVTNTGHVSEAQNRALDQLQIGNWEPVDAEGRNLQPVPTPESKRPNLASIYALSKYSQERMCLIAGEAYKYAVTALRFFNVYGTRQALSNPYTGVLAIFGSRLLNGNPPLVYEDGRQQRDFVHVTDVAKACRLAMEVPEAAGKVFNIGSGSRYTISQIGRNLGEILGKNHLPPLITGKFRFGDIRHCFSDISFAKEILRYEPQMSLEKGLIELSGWLARQEAQDLCELAGRELQRRGLIA